MIGHAELRELDEALSEERAEGIRQERRTPYITSHIAVGMAMTKAVTTHLKHGFSDRKR